MNSQSAILDRAGIEVPVEPVSTVIPPGGVSRPLNGVLSRPGTDALGFPMLRHWEDGLTDYMDQAGLAVAASLID